MLKTSPTATVPDLAPEITDTATLIPARNVRVGDAIDYPHGPAHVLRIDRPAYLLAALGDGAGVLVFRGRQPQIVTGGQLVSVLLPRPEAA